jgi:hypothetical protein
MTIENALKNFQENYQAKNFGQAIEVLEKNSKDFDPVIWHYNMGSSYAQLGVWADARYHFLKAERLGLSTEMLRQSKLFVETKLEVDKWEKSLTASDFLIAGTRILGEGPLITLSLMGFLILAFVYKKMKSTSTYLLAVIVLFLTLNIAIKYMPFKFTLTSMPIFEGPSKIFVPRTEIPAGIIILSLSEEGWEHVIYPSRYEGWIKKTNGLKNLGD